MGAFDYKPASSAGIKPTGLINGGSATLLLRDVGASLVNPAPSSVVVKSMAVSTGNTLQRVLSLSGAGALSFLAVTGAGAGASMTHRIKLTLDGVIVYDSTSGVVTGTQTFCASIIGVFGSGFLAEFPLLFDKSCLIEYAGSINPAGNAAVGYTYYPR